MDNSPANDERRPSFSFHSSTTLSPSENATFSEKRSTKHLSSASTLPPSDAKAKSEKSARSDQIFNEKSEPPPLPQLPAPVYFESKNPFDGSNVFGDATSEKSRLERLINHAHRRNKWLTPPKWLSVVLQLLGYLGIACAVYFFFIGYPLWNGAIYNFWFAYKNDLRIKAGAVIFIGIALLYALAPLLVTFEKPPNATEEWSRANAEKALDTAVIVACHRSANVIRNTLECALKTFPARNIFVMANGNSEVPLDHTEDICREMGVRHLWVPIGSKIAAQYVGAAAAYQFRYCLLIDDDVALPDVFPIVTERIELGKEGDKHGNAKVKCIGYTLNATDEELGRGNLCQQAQDLEYKLAGLSRTLFGKLGSASFPHGAISLWERSFLELCFQKHPGYRISEDWFFGLMCKKLGGRIKFCSQVFVKTAVPGRVVFGGKSARAGYGELTVTSQRLWRWNFFLMARIFYNSWYILANWRLRHFELFTKLDMFQELYSTLLLFLFPFIFPISLGVDPGFTIGLTLGVTVMYMVITAIFNEIHLRIRGQMVARRVVYLYYPAYKLFLRLVNVASCFTSIFNYARYYSVRHPKVVEDEKLLQYMLSVVSPQSRRAEDLV